MARRRAGSTSLELALVAPVLIVLLVALAEFAYAMMVDGVLNHAARAAGRSGFTGVLSAGYTDRRAQVCDAIRRNTLGILDQSRLTIRGHAYASYGGVDGAPLTNLSCGKGDWDSGQTTTALGQSAQVVVYVVHYSQPVLSILGQAALGRDRIEHEARLAVRNEPYPKTD
jgi:Flp pilus assembly protein TadG